MPSVIPGPLAAYIPEPTIVLTGCQAWDAQPVTPETCPVCRGGIRKGHDTTHCARCSSSSPAIESRVLAARVGLRVRSEIEHAERETRADLVRQTDQGTLTESQRRRIWMGYSKTGTHSKNPAVVNRAKVGREWLAQIDQLPNWELILDKHGKVVGRDPNGKAPV